MVTSSTEISLTPTHGLVSPHKFYPARIKVPHPQLRHLISTADPDRVYYVNGYDVFLLDVQTKRNTLLATVPFEARCLAADLGWVCVGGELHGNCAFIKLETENGTPRCFGHELFTEQLGGEIVNSMNIRILKGEGDTPDEPVVVVSNNDKSLKIFSLARRQVLTTLTHPCPINFAALSPDTSLIAAVGDCNKVFFYKRHLDKSGAADRFATYEWRLYAEPAVPAVEPVDDDFSFAAVFSPSGHLCAASSSGGSICVFDVEAMLNSDREPPEAPIICSFRSSRCGTLYGCVRSMEFSPAPWDILVWAEGHGRIGVADVRRGFVRRQILELDRRKVDLIQVEDGTPTAYRNLGFKERLKEQHLSRLRSMRGMSARDGDPDLAMDDAPNSPDSQSRHPHHTRQSLLRYHQGSDLDARERSVIDALEITMDNVMESVEHLGRPYSVNYTASPRLRPSVLAEAARDTATTAMLHGERPNSGTRSLGPRRRPSVVLSESSSSHNHLAPAEITRTRLSASPGRMSEDEASAMSASVLTSAAGISTQPNPHGIPPSDPWHVIQSALETARQADNTPANALARVEAALEAERQLGAQLERQLADERDLSTLLRRQLETQQRLLLENTSQLDALQQVARESNARVEASLERVIQQSTLTSEAQHVQRRSQELRSEQRANEQFARRLESERARLLSSSPPSPPQPATSSSSATTSTLPTTRSSASSTAPAPVPTNISSILSDYTYNRARRLQHIENLARQVRRAETRVAAATSDIQDLQTALQREVALAGSPAPAELSGSSSGSTDDHRRTTQLQATARREQTLLTSGGRRGTELGRIPVQDAELRLADMMFLRTMNRATDRNGNWVRTSGLSAMTSPVAAGSMEREGREMSAEEIARGPGTTGVGFSPDGRILYAGSEEGVFEFKVNIRDRMMFPACEMR